MSSVFSLKEQSRRLGALTKTVLLVRRIYSHLN